MRKVILSSLVVCSLIVAVGSHNAYAKPIQFGVRGGTYSDPSDPFIGADAKIGLGGFHVIPNIEWVFVDGGDFFTLNVDGTMTIFPIPILDPYVGAGVGWVRVKPDNLDATNEGAFNLIGGVSFNVPLDPFVQIKYVITEDNTWVFAVGARF